MKKEFVAVILAGGVGKRFWPLSANKALFPFFGKPFMVHSVFDVLPKDATRVVIVTNKDNDYAIRTMQFPVLHATVIQENPNGMANAILCAKEKLRDCSLLIVNADDINDASMYQEVVDKARKTQAFGVIPCFKTVKYLPYGYLVFKGDALEGIVEKPGEGNEPSEFVNVLGHYIDDSALLIDELQKTTSDRDDVYEKTLSRLMKQKRFVACIQSDRNVGLKYPWNVLDAMDALLKRVKAYRGKNVLIRSNVVIEGAVYIDDDVKIFENTKIVGPCYIGKETVIGSNNMIRHSHIGANCVTGFNSDITRSYIGDSCWFHSNYIGDSVLEGNVSMGYGTALANLRLDEGEIRSMITNEKVNTRRNKLGAIIGKHVRIGINTSIMPGIKIGNHSYIGAGIVLDKDLPDERYCIGKTAYTITKNKQTSQASREDFRKLLR